MFDPAAYERLPDGLRGVHFAEPFHQRLFDAIASGVMSGSTADPTILVDRFAQDEAFAAFGGHRYLVDMVDRAPPSANAKHYAETIMDLAMRRDLIRIAGDLMVAAPDASKPAREHLSEAEGALFGLAEAGEASRAVATFSEALEGALEQAEAAFRRDGRLAGIATGLIDLDQKLGGLHPSDLLVLAGRPSMGKAQPLESRILMADGSWRTMGEIGFGDALASVDGAPSVVTGVYPQGEREVFRVTLSDGRSTLACAEHLWTVDCSKWGDRRRTVSTADLARMLQAERYRRRISLPLVSGDFGRDDALPLDPWLLGALLGNGGISGNSVLFSTADAATLFRVQKVVGSDRVRDAGGDYDYRLIANDCAPEHNVALALLNLGLKGTHSHDKFVPPAYLKGSRETRLAVLQGLLDTDGWVETFGAVRIALASRRLAEDVQTLVRSLGGVCSISVKHPTFTHKGEKKAGLPSYVCNISHPDRASLMTLARKRRRCAEGMRFRAPTIVSVEPAGVEPVQCIAVSHPDHLYVTDDYIVTHNTALALNVAMNAARAGSRVFFSSLEMSKEQLATRALAELAGVSGDRIRKGAITEADFARLHDAAREYHKLPIHIDETGGISIAKLCARARRHQRKHGIDLLIVDYLQLITIDGAKGGNRVQEVTAITTALKALAKELNVPIIALSQLSRQVEAREDKRPQLSDLRESGSIEQDADVVMF
ncbi:MAG: DnaB-like helicase C-terminal domain-containing protein, partial [Brevundimonas sp.]